MKRFVAAAAALVMTLAMAGCSSKSSSSTVKEKEAADMFISRAAFDKDFDGVEDIEKGPVLGIENVTAKAGETVKVSITVILPTITGLCADSISHIPRSSSASSRRITKR